MINFELSPEEIIELRRQHKAEKSKRNAVSAYKIYEDELHRIMNDEFEMITVS